MNPSIAFLSPVVRSSDPRLGFTPFSSVIASRRAEAKRTLLVQVAKRASAEDLYLYCTRNVGKINKMMFFHNESSKSFSVRKKKITHVAFFKL